MTKDSNQNTTKREMRPGLAASAKTVTKEVVIDIKTSAASDYADAARTKLIETEWEYPACRLPWHYFERFASGRSVKQPRVRGLSIEITRG